MEEKAEYGYAVAQSNLLNNSGGPHSRVRSETVKESFLSGNDISAEIDCYKITIPENVPDIEEWLLQMAKAIGWDGWKEITRHILLPREKLMVFPMTDELKSTKREVRQLLAVALVLSMSNRYTYLPDGPRIFTRSRLDRSIKLLQINSNHFYELE
ncbi:MAG: hypothetical protein ACOH2V_10480 [Candidatus Saccharimonadaceae bacterium]